MSPLEKKYKNKGFIALISAIVISMALLVVTVTLSYSSFFSRYTMLESEYKERSSALAEGCVASALLKLAGNSSYIGGETITIGSDICSIRTISVSGSNKIIETQASFPNTNSKAYTDLRVAVDIDTLVVASWQEIPSF